MAFTVQDFHDLVRLLQQHPEWQAELRRLVLSEELLTLPELAHKLLQAHEQAAERLDRLEATVAELTRGQQALLEAHRRAEERLDRLEATVAELTRNQQALLEAHRRTEKRVDHLSAQMEDMYSQLGSIRGVLLEEQYRRNAPSYFGRLARKIRVLSSQHLADLLDAAIDQGSISWEERDKLLACDVVMTGLGRDDGAPLYIVAEVSIGIGYDDVDRAVARAQILRRVVDVPVIPTVAGQRIDAVIDEYARGKGVWRVLNGHVIPPDQPVPRSRHGPPGST